MSQQRRKGSELGGDFLVLSAFRNLAVDMIEVDGLASLFRKTSRSVFPFLALTLLILSSGAVLFVGSHSQIPSNDNENVAYVSASGTPPVFVLSLPPVIYAEKGVVANLTISVLDVDDDPVHVEWSWGDGSPNATNDTSPASTAQWVNQTHTWDPFVEQGSGDFNISYPYLNVTIDDGNGNFVTITSTVEVYVPFNAPPEVHVLGPSAPVDPLDDVTIYANASDPEGESLTWTFVFNDTQTDFLTIVSYTAATAPNETVWNNITHVFGAEGSFTVTVNVSDALPPNQTFPHNVSDVAAVTAVWNQAPITSAEITANPVSPTFNPSIGYVDVTYSVQAADPDGDVMTATWDFGHGGPGAVNTSDGTPSVNTFVQVGRYTSTGVFNVTVSITDGRVNHTVTLYKIMTIALINYAPRFNQSLPPRIIVTKGVLATFNITVYDANNDSVHVEWLWGDGSPNATNDTQPAFTAQPVSQTHTWDPYVEQGSGNFNINYPNLNVTLTDTNGSSTTLSRPVQVFVPENPSPSISIDAPSTIVDPYDNVTIIGYASDPNGESLTWTFVFNDSQTDFLTIVRYTGTSAPNELMSANVSHIFGAEGDFKVTMYVSDALPPNQTGFHNLSVSATIIVRWNFAPSTSSEIQATPIEPVINATIGYILVNYSIQAYDLDGEIITATWDFGDGGPGAVNVSNGTTASYTFIQWVNYTTTGPHHITVVVTDGRANHTITLYRNLTVTSTNLPPNVEGLLFVYPSGDYARPNETLTFTFKFSDPEHDTIQVIIDFGDGTVEYYNLTEYDVTGNVSLTFTHAFTTTGTKKVAVSYTDNQLGLYEHLLYQNLTIEVKIPPYVPPKNWSWWDYTSLGLLLMIPVLVALRFFMVAARRKRLEAEGLSLEEWKLIKSEQLSQQGKDQKK